MVLYQWDVLRRVRHFMLREFTIRVLTALGNYMQVLERVLCHLGDNNIVTLNMKCLLNVKTISTLKGFLTNCCALPSLLIFII